MMNNLAPARARESAEAWLADRKLALPTPPRVSAAFVETALVDAFVAGWGAATAPETGAEVNAIIASLIRDAQAHGLADDADERADDAAQRIVAYLGAIHREEQDQWAIERAEGQRQLDDAGALMREAAETFRSYEAHHRAKASEEGRPEKAERNALMASRLEAWLRGDSIYPITADGAYAAHASFRSANPAEVLRDIAEGMVDGETIKGVDHASFDAAAAQLDAPGQPDAENPEVGEDWFKTARLVHGLAPTASGKVPGRQQAALLNGAIGLRVEKRSGDYDFDGEVRAVIVKRSGEVRYAVEDDRGLLLVMNARQCGLEEVARLEAPWRKEGVADLAAFRLTTGDPRFDPGKPVCVNGYHYTPTKED